MTGLRLLEFAPLFEGLYPYGDIPANGLVLASRGHVEKGPRFMPLEPKHE
jgi:hypothetical protein